MRRHTSILKMSIYKNVISVALNVCVVIYHVISDDLRIMLKQVGEMKTNKIQHY